MMSASFILAAVGALLNPKLVLHFVPDQALATNLFGLSAFVIGPAWATLAVILLRRNGKRGLWILIGLPFALNCTAFFVLIIFACATGQGCL
jgi:hypothetical protein